MINSRDSESDYEETSIMSKEELIKNFKKCSPDKIIVWGKIQKSVSNTGLAKKIDEMYGHYELTEKGIQLVKKK